MHRCSIGAYEILYTSRSIGSRKYALIGTRCKYSKEFRHVVSGKGEAFNTRGMNHGRDLKRKICTLKGEKEVRADDDALYAEISVHPVNIYIIRRKWRSYDRKSFALAGIG